MSRNGSGASGTRMMPCAHDGRCPYTCQVFTRWQWVKFALWHAVKPPAGMVAARLPLAEFHSRPSVVWYAHEIEAIEREVAMLKKAKTL